MVQNTRPYTVERPSDLDSKPIAFDHLRIPACILLSSLLLLSLVPVRIHNATTESIILVIIELSHCFTQPAHSSFYYARKTLMISESLCEYGLQVTPHSLLLLTRALLHIWYFNAFKQTHKPWPFRAPGSYAETPSSTLMIPLQASYISTVQWSLSCSFVQMAWRSRDTCLNPARAFGRSGDLSACLRSSARYRRQDNPAMKPSSTTSGWSIDGGRAAGARGDAGVGP